EFVGLIGSGKCLLSPGIGFFAILAVVIFGQPEVTDRLGDGRFCFGNIGRVVADHLIQHFLWVFGRVQHRVNVGFCHLRDSSQNGLFRHIRYLSCVTGCCRLVAIIAILCELQVLEASAAATTESSTTAQAATKAATGAAEESSTTARGATKTVTTT